jgi:hypothetical protein
MTTTAGHSFYIGPIGSFYYQVNDTGSWEPLVRWCYNSFANEGLDMRLPFILNGVVMVVIVWWLCNQCLSPLTLWVWTLYMARCTRYNIMW